MANLNLIPLDPAPVSGWDKIKLTKLVGHLTSSRHSGSGWTVKLANNWTPIALARGEKSSAIWYDSNAVSANTVGVVDCRMHLFKFAKALLHTEGVLEENIAQYFFEDPIVETVDHRKFSKKPGTNGPDGLIMLRIASQVQEKRQIQESSAAADSPFMPQYYVNDGISERDLLAYYYIDSKYNQIYVLLLTYPTLLAASTQQIIILHQKAFYNAAQSFKYTDPHQDSWNGQFVSPTRGA